jgi:hypothetical protein
MSIIPLSSRRVSQVQSKIQNEITRLTLLLKISIWGITCLLTPIGDKLRLCAICQSCSYKKLPNLKVLANCSF